LKFFFSNSNRTGSGAGTTSTASRLRYKTLFNKVS
jgi:hypothetical protein